MSERNVSAVQIYKAIIDTVSEKIYNDIADTVSEKEREVITMKKNVGSVLALYPTPLVVVGAAADSKPTWTLVGHVGIIGHDRVMVSLAANHYINGVIKDANKLSINIVDRSILPEADYVGSVSGAKVDKSAVFDYEMGVSKTPIIKKSPLAIECTVVDIYNTKGFESFICTIDSTLVEEACLNEEGKIDYNELKPVLFEFPTYEYLETGEVLGKCLSFKEKR